MERSNIIGRFRGEGVCSNRQSAVIWERGYGQIVFALFSVYEGEGIENVIWGRGWQKTSEYNHVGERGSKIAQKTVI